MQIMDTKNRSIKLIWNKWSVAIKIMPFVLFVALMKFLSHKSGFEVLELNTLFTSLVGGAIFLIGFLLSGVLSDYKESEKLPSELVASLKTIFDDTYTIAKCKNSENSRIFIEFQKSFVNSLLDWFYKKEKTRSILKKISMMNDYFVEFDKEGVQANYIIKLKNEQNSIRKMVLRIDTIRDTDFICSAYTIVEVMGFLIALGLVVIKIEPFYSSLFFTVLVTFLILYMLFLIRDLDNPFDYRTHGESGTEISLKSLHDLIIEMEDF